MADKIIVVKMTGTTFKKALENGISAYPKYDGRFPSISGVRFSFDPLKESGDRIVFEDISTESGPLDPNKIYKVAMKGFLVSGKDGYTMFRDGGIIEVLIADEDAVLIQEVMYHFFNSFDNKLSNHSSRDRIRAERMKMFNTDEDNITEEGFIKIKPTVDGRITNLYGHKLEEEN